MGGGVGVGGAGYKDFLGASSWVGGKITEVVMVPTLEDETERLFVV